MAKEKRDELVKDAFAHKEYLSLKNNPLIKNPVYKNSKGKEFSLRTKDIPKDLPESDKVKYTQLKQKYEELKEKMLIARNKAIVKKSVFAPGLTYLEGYEDDVLDKFSKFWSVEEIHKYLSLDIGRPVSISTLEKFRIQKRLDIQKGQDEYLKTTDELRFVHKKSRLEELSLLYNQNKQIWDKSGRALDYRNLLQTMEQIRKEVEGDNLNVNVKGKLDIELTLNTHIQQELLQKLTLMDIIVSRIAAKQNINPQYLLFRLNTSLYSKFSGAQPITEEDLNQEPFYPSSMMFNIQDIEKKAVEVKNEEEKMKKIVIPIKESKNDVKSKILKMLDDKKGK